MKKLLEKLCTHADKNILNNCCITLNMSKHFGFARERGMGEIEKESEKYREKAKEKERESKKHQREKERVRERG